jgi:ectoine hydroxylase-related dioxygenase (phytanoyl-CoA dioxygenase family)
MIDLKSQFNSEGWAGPLPVLTQQEIVKYKTLIETADSKFDLMSSDFRCKANVLFPWVNEISRHPALISYVEQLIGPNFHCYDAMFFIKQPNSKKDVSWHQDGTYWNFTDKQKAITVWIAFNDVTPAQGSIKYIPKSHLKSQIQHQDIKTDTNILMRGQTAIFDNFDDPVITTVPAGNVLIHSPYMLHSSGSNSSNTTRFAMNMMFVSTECRPLINLAPESTIMVNGIDHYNYMEHDPQPTGEWNTDIKIWRKSYDQQHVNYYKIEQRIE